MSFRNQRLCRMQLMSDEVLEDVQWAFDQVIAKRRTLTNIHKRFNSRIAKHNFEPISQSSFNRWSLKVNGGLIARPRISYEPNAADELFSGVNLSNETHAAFKMFLSLYARDIRSGRDFA